MCPVYRVHRNECLWVCAFTFSLGGHFECCRALARAVAVVGHNPEAIFRVWHKVLDGDLQLPRTAGIHNSLPDADTHKQQKTFHGLNCKLFSFAVKKCWLVRIPFYECAYIESGCRPGA